MKAIHKILIAGLALCAMSACDEKEFLTEVPYSIYSTENALVSQSDYQAMINHLYFQIKRSNINVADQGYTGTVRGCNDFAYNSNKLNPTGKATGAVVHKFNGTDRGYGPTENNDWETWVTPDRTKIHYTWGYTWDLICNANVVISRIDDADIPESAKNVMKGEALFARSWGYLHLCHLYGGLPIMEEEVSTPSREYTRASRTETYQFVYDGFKAAAALLPDVDKAGDGKINKQACQHFMAETAICLGNYAQAITDATSVINYSGLKLMTSRFGALADKPGDVYWDLFRAGNYNYSSGNKEGIMVLQCDYQNSASQYSNKGDYDYFVRDYNCRYIAFQAKTSASPSKAVAIFNSTPTSGMCGRAYGYLHPTDHFLSEIWAGMDGDIRNSEYNIKRDVIVNGKSSGYYGKWLVKDGVLDDLIANGYDTYEMYWWPIITKVANTTYDWPENEKTKVGGTTEDEFNGFYAQTNDGRDHSHKDCYMARLAETYLLRAEAYVKSGDATKAAADINVLRQRSGAPAVSGTVDIDYVLDERMRELYAEEDRSITLMRMGLLDTRTKKYNFVAGPYISKKHNLFPIPSESVINNALADLTQNEGY